MQKTKLLVIAITTAAIITVATTTSLSAATPAFARVNCNEDNSTCSGGESLKKGGDDTPSVHGIHGVTESEQFTISGGGGSNSLFPGFVGGGGGRTTCSFITSTCTDLGGQGFHEKGPGGNSP